MPEWFWFVFTFLFGVAVGAGGTFYGNKFTDQRREREAATRKTSDFEKVRLQMPALIAEMRADLDHDDSRHVREFFVLSKSLAIGGSSIRRFIYYEEDHENLPGKISILENRGYVNDVTPKDASIYRMTEEFVELMLASPGISKSAT